MKLRAPLPDEARAALAPFFPAATIAAVRLAALPPVPRLWGLALGRTILVPRRLRGATLLATLFHELVHVEQARQLGLARFVQRYVGGWLANGRRYAAIPLERDAFDLQRRFAARPGEPFDAAAEIARRLQVGR